jgi:restriction endonuclease
VVLVVGLAFTAGAITSRKATGKKARRRIQATYGDAAGRIGNPRPAQWDGPSPTALLAGWTSRDGQYSLRWWQFEHLVAEFLRREGFENVVVRESDLDDGGIDINGSHAGLPVIAQVKHYGAEEYASIKEIGRFCHTTKTAGAAMGYFVTSGQVGKNSRLEAAKADPPVTIVSGPSLWKMVQAQRAGQPSGLAKPIHGLAKTGTRGCLSALLPLGSNNRR